ncbi:carboxymuconolactone decarboxylase family protein [Pseudomonas mucidolens]|uniref:Alkylhydroperoxidase AhpD family core domain-containing protein n=1 Tax=Pseudomonas mucidolens TaxID=46679 RepID=A0A1H2M9K0_9PSED|nr:carboxymuconolactone decarboxylase family protein [Pseudomonas mucidolens]SDU89927.1 alkylhydroperoxidase AhpD family core domain-containing protein [Pseudomonas mucidolens]SQH34284.1 alkylhydroperoxidase [Pseudomonas mucidolens]
MHARIDFYAASPNAMKAMLALEAVVGKLSIELPLLELVRLRVSQINGCAFCLDVHSADALKGGETERRLYTLSAWRETPFFTPRERAALAWAESLTLISQTHACDEDYALLSEQFSPSEQVDLSLAIASINSWNRLAVGFRKMPA